MIILLCQKGKNAEYHIFCIIGKIDTFKIYNIAFYRKNERFSF